MSMLEQRSNEWFEQRRGRFTASRISELMGVKGLGLTGEGYAFEMAVEIAFGRNQDEGFTTFDMQRGIQQEPLAFELFKNKMELDFIEVQKSEFFPYGANAGASPDGLVGSNEILEIKCPQPKKFFSIVNNGIEAVDKSYIYQMQMQMMCTNSIGCHFMNYLQYNGKELTNVIYVERDEKTIDLIKERIELAVQLRDEYAKGLIKNYEKNKI